MAIREEPRRAAGASRAVAVDIGFQAVRVVEVETRAGGARLVRRGMAPVPPDCWDNLASARESLAQAVRTALSTAGIHATQVVASLPRRLVTLKHARLPHAAPEQVRGMVQFEAQQYIPFPIEEVVIDHQVISDETDEMMTVMVVAARRSLVADLLAVFERAGLEVIRLSVSALALAEHASYDTLPLALLDVGPGEMEVAVVADGRPLFTRAAEFAVTDDRVAGGPALAGEVARSIAAYQNEHRSQPVGRLLVAGEPGCLEQVEETLTGLLDVPVGRMNGRLLPAADPDALGYAVAIGLAVEADGHGLSRINLIPTSLAERRLAARRRLHSGLAAVLVLALAAFGLFALTRSLETQRRDTREAVQANRRKDLYESALKKSQSERDRLARTYQTVAGGLGRDRPAVDIMKAVSDAMPRGESLYLTQLAFERGGVLTIHGSAKSETAATAFVLTLQGSGVFSEARLSYMGDAQSDMLPAVTSGGAAALTKPPDQTRFIIACKLQGVGDREPDTGGTIKREAPAATEQADATMGGSRRP